MPEIQMKCYHCGKRLTDTMRIEYDRIRQHYYCGSSCALADGVEVMGGGINPHNTVMQRTHNIRIGRNGFLFSQE